MAQIDQPPPPPPPPPAPLENEPFRIVEEMPCFPGCEDITDSQERKQCSKDKLKAYLANNLTYPKEAEYVEVEGTGVIRFVVEKDGSIIDIEVVRSLGYGTEEEMIRLVNQMNEDGIKWIPGKQNGRPVRVLFNLPIRFGL